MLFTNVATGIQMPFKTLATIDINKVYSCSLRFVSWRGRTYKLLILSSFKNSYAVKASCHDFFEIEPFKTFSLVLSGSNLLVTTLTEVAGSYHYYSVWPLVLQKYTTRYSRSQGMNRILCRQLFLLQEPQHPLALSSTLASLEMLQPAIGSLNPLEPSVSVSII